MTPFRKRLKVAKNTPLANDHFWDLGTFFQWQ